MNQHFSMRPAVEQDCAAINAIYNYYVQHSTCTYDLAAVPDSERVEWLSSHGGRYPVIVVEMSGMIVGWGSLSPFRTRPGYNRTVENSVYVHSQFQRKGIGSAILVRLIALARDYEYHSIIAGIDGEQAASISLHEKMGFIMAGRLVQVGWKFDRWLDAYFYQFML